MNSLIKWRWRTGQREGWDGPEVIQGFKPGHCNSDNAFTELSPEFRGRSLVELEVAGRSPFPQAVELWGWILREVEESELFEGEELKVEDSPLGKDLREGMGDGRGCVSGRGMEGSGQGSKFQGNQGGQFPADG